MHIAPLVNQKCVVSDSAPDEEARGQTVRIASVDLVRQTASFYLIGRPRDVLITLPYIFLSTP